MMRLPNALRIKAMGMALAISSALSAPLFGAQIGSFTYELVGETIMITDYLTTAAGEVVIPS